MSVEFSVGRYYHLGGMDELKQKLEQYPEGSAFLFDAGILPHATVARVLAQLRPWLAAQGYEVQEELR